MARADNLREARGRRIASGKSISIVLSIKRSVEISQDYSRSKGLSFADIYLLFTARFQIHFMLVSQVFVFIHCSFFTSSNFTLARCPRPEQKANDPLVLPFSTFPPPARESNMKISSRLCSSWIKKYNENIFFWISLKWKRKGEVSDFTRRKPSSHKTYVTESDETRQKCFILFVHRNRRLRDVSCG